jgi:hypothetical protein
MATTLLIVGYLLAVPPLIVFGKMWRRRWWLVYLAEILGALAIAAGWLLHGEPWAVAVNLLWAVGFGISFPLFAGRGKRWWVAVTTGLIASLALGGLGYALVRSQFGKTKVAKESVGNAVTDFRRSKGSGGSSAEGVPAAGVYQFAGTGKYTVAVAGLGKDTRVLPKIIPALLVSEGRCWTLNIRFFKQHQRTVRYCSDKKGGLRMVWLLNQNKFFGLEHKAKSRCEPDQIFRRGDKPGHSIAQLCKPMDDNQRFGKTNAKATFDYMATESMTIGGQKIKVHHLRRTLIVKSLQSARVEQHLYYADQTGMLVRYRIDGKGSGLATFKSDYELTLMSLSPKR